MKKSKLLVFLSALLCIVMIFSSCSLGSTDDTENDDQKIPEVPETPKNQLNFTATETTINLENVVNDIVKYLGYKDLSAGDKVEAKVPTQYEGLFVNGNDVEVEAQSYGYVYFVETTETQRVVVIQPGEDAEEGAEPEEITLTDVTVTHYVYNSNTDSMVYKTESVTTKDGERKEVYYEINVYAGGLFIVTRYDIEVTPPVIDPETEEELSPEIVDYIPTYTVYDANGEVVAEPEELGSVSTASHIGYNAVDIADKTYCVIDGEVVKTFDRDHDYELPVDPDYVIGDYRYFEFSKKLQVVDANEKIVVEVICEADEYFILLDNGNILVVKSTILPEDAEKYDVKLNGRKIAMSYSLVNVPTGTKSEIKFASGFVPVSFVNTYGAFGVNANKYKNTTVNGDYVYAVGYKAGSEQLVGSILNADLTVATTFTNPAINASSDVAFVNRTEFVVSGRVGDQTVSYTVNVPNKSIHIADRSAVSADYVLNDYIIINGVVYDNNFYHIYDLYQNNYTIGWQNIGKYVEINAEYNMIYVMKYNEYNQRNEYGVFCKNEYGSFSYYRIIDNDVEQRFINFEETSPNGYFMIYTDREDFDYGLNRRVTVYNCRAQYIFSFNNRYSDMITVNGNLIEYDVTRQYNDEYGYHSETNTYYVLLK